MIKHALSYRFEVYLITACLVLFCSLIFPRNAFDEWISLLFLNINVMAGFFILAMRRKMFWYYAGLFVVGMLFYLLKIANTEGLGTQLDLTRLAFYSVFYTIVTVEIILQVWNVSEVNRKVILGLICGYISLGLVAFSLSWLLKSQSPIPFRAFPRMP